MSHPKAEPVRTAYLELNNAIEACQDLDTISRLYARYVLAVKGNKVYAARTMGVDRRTLQRWERDTNRGVTPTRTQRARGIVARHTVSTSALPSTEADTL